MKSVKFRAWDEDGFMFTPDRISWSGEDAIVWGAGDTFGINGSTVELMQFTGLIDKNGVDVYEGDIVRCKSKNYDDIIEGEVYWCNTGYWAYDKTSGFDYILGMHGDGWIEVLGNVYENKELL